MREFATPMQQIASIASPTDSVECFETDHASHCDVCMNEAIITARMTKEGKNPKEIQKAIDAYYAG